MTHSAAPNAETIVAILRRRAAEVPDQPVLTFLDETGADRDHLNCLQVADAADAVAAVLAQHGRCRGERVVLLYPPGSDFVKAFVGCIVAGVVPVPVYPPNPLRLQ